MTDDAKSSLTQLMTTFLPDAPIAWIIALSADAVAAELAGVMVWPSLNPGRRGCVLGDMRYIKRFLFTLAAMVGLLAIAATPAVAGTSFNHALPDEHA